MPQRIQRNRTRGWRMPENAVYVGRPGPWGNPYTISAMQQRIGKLAGWDLACWCPLDQPCHGDVLLEIANGGPA